MYNDFYNEHSIFIDSVRKFCAEKFAPHLRAWEREGMFPNQVFRDLGDAGYLGMLLPGEYGGSEGDYLLAGAWCETFGELCSVGLTTAVNMHALVISHALAKYGTKEAKQRWLPKAVTGEVIGAYAFTEPGAGSDLANARTRATRKGNRWVIDGAKTFITNGARADFILVLARNDFEAGYKGFTTFLVDTKRAGFSVVRKLDKLGWRDSDTAELTFEAVEVDDSCVLGKVGEGWMQAASNLNWERIMLTLTSLGGARACFKDALRYARERTAFGKRLIDIGVISETFHEMYRRIVLSEAICHKALLLLNDGAECRLEVSLAKRKVCEDAVWIADRAIQVLGGYGYTTEFTPERWWRDLRLMPIGGGTSEIMGNIVAKQQGWL